MASDLPVGVPVFGVRFRLGVAGAALGLPAGEFPDADGADRRRSGARRSTSGWPPAACGALLQVVRERLAGAPVDRLARAAALAMARPGARVDGARAGLSERQLRRRFVDAVGYGPKTLARVLRFQRFLALARLGRGPGAAGAGRGLRRPGAPHA